MLYQINVETKRGQADPVSAGIKADIIDLGIKSVKSVLFTQLYFIETEASESQVNLIAQRLLSDPVTSNYEWRIANGEWKSEKSAVRIPRSTTGTLITVLHKPGVMDPVEASALKAIADLKINATVLRTGRQFILQGKITPAQREQIARKILANEVIDDIHYGPMSLDKITIGNPYEFRLNILPWRKMAMDAMMKINKDLQLSLNEQELKTIQDYFKSIDRDPTDVELDTIAQTWSEHCKHKTLMGLIEYTEGAGAQKKTEQIENILKQTIMKATLEIKKPWCISVFKDNAGIIDFDDKNALTFKVETHNHPSAIEPYGGAGTGIGGVIRDTLGCGLGAKPILNTDVFCFGLPDLPHNKLPAGVLHPKRIMKGVVAGVRDYGNRMGIPTPNGAVYFDDRYTGNPLVYCGNVGLMPKDKCAKKVRAGDLILLVGGRTGRDGIHGVTFASAELTEKSEEVSSIAVQIGNAIMEKKVADTVLQARDRNLYTAITDCGGGGLSSAIGEMGEETGVEVDLEKVPLKYQGLSYTEIWISEAQERMVMSVPVIHKDKILEIFQRENVDATFIGRFTGNKRLVLKYNGKEVANLEMEFLHHGGPKFFRKAEWSLPKHKEPRRFSSGKTNRVNNYGKTLKQILAMPNIASKEWIIRQYDHEVQGGSVLKPLAGIKNDGPSDACVSRPLLNSYKGVVVSNGMNPKYSEIDPYHMAASSIDEALRNIVAVGGDLERTALLDNFAWGNTNKPDRLGALVRASRACYDISKVYGTPFISGKDSLNNEFFTKGKSIAIPHTLLISAISVIDDVRKTVSMDFKEPGNLIYIIGATKEEMGGSHYYELLKYIGNSVPVVNAAEGRKTMLALSSAIKNGFVRACHDLSEGGLAVTLAEMAFAGEIGAKIDISKVPCDNAIKENDVILFSESNSRFLAEVSPKHRKDFESALKDCAFAFIGETAPVKMLRVTGLDKKLIINESLNSLKDAWQKLTRQFS